MGWKPIGRHWLEASVTDRPGLLELRFFQVEHRDSGHGEDGAEGLTEGGAVLVDQSGEGDDPESAGGGDGDDDGRGKLLPGPLITGNTNDGAKEGRSSHPEGSVFTHWFFVRRRGAGGSSLGTPPMPGTPYEKRGEDSGDAALEGLADAVDAYVILLRDAVRPATEGGAKSLARSGQSGKPEACPWRFDSRSSGGGRPEGQSQSAKDEEYAGPLRRSQGQAQHGKVPPGGEQGSEAEIDQDSQTRSEAGVGQVEADIAQSKADDATEKQGRKNGGKQAGLTGNTISYPCQETEQHAGEDQPDGIGPEGTE